MKKFLYIIGVLVALGIIGIFSTYSLAQAVVKQEISEKTISSQQYVGQQIFIDELADVLIQQQIPVKTIGLRTEEKIMNTTVIDITVNSNSNDDILAPGDMLNASLIFRAANIMQEKGLGIGAVGINFINTNGVIFCKGFEPVRSKELQFLGFYSPLILDDPTVNEFILSTLDTSKFSLRGLSIAVDPNGLRTAKFEILSLDITTANEEIVKFLSNLRMSVSDLNTKENCQISAYEVNLYTSEQTILNYTFDLLFNRESSWQADSLTATWYPSAGRLSQE